MYKMSSTQVLPKEFFLLNQKSTVESSEVVGFLFVENKIYQVKKGSNKIGRDPEICSIVVENDTISKLHSVIECEGVDDVFIYDVGSTNQTKLGNIYLKPHCRYKLNHKDMITLGNVDIKYISLHSTESGPYWFPLKNAMPSKLGDSISNFEDIFDLETQINIPLAKTNEILCQPTTSESKKTVTSSTSKNSISPQLSTLVDRDNKKTSVDLVLSQPQTTVTSLSQNNCCKKISQNNSQNDSQNQLNLNPCVQHQIQLSDNQTNTGEFSSGKINSVLCTKNDCTEEFKKNDDNDKNSQKESTLDNDQAQMFSTLTYVNFLLAKENSVSVKQECTNIYSGVLKQNNGIQNNLDCEANVALLKKDSILMENFAQSFNLDDEKEKENILLATQKSTTNGNSDEINDNQSIFCVSSEEAAFKEKNDFSFSNMSEAHLSDLKKNFSDSQCDSYLEITIENTMQEKSGNNLNPLTNFCTRKMENQHATEKNKELTSREVYYENSEMAVDGKNSSTSDSNSFICSQYEENIHKLSSSNSFSIGLSKDEEKSQSFRDIFKNIASLKNSQDSIFTVTSVVLGERHGTCDSNLENNLERLERISLQHTGKTKYTPMSLTKDLTSFVPETSDDDSTISDLEIIENTPNYMDCFQDSKTNYQLPRVLKNSDSPSKNNEFSNSNSQYQNLSLECDNNSDSSYIFEIMNEERKNGLNEENEESSKELMVVETSDSNESDIIDSTPTKMNLISIKASSFEVVKEKKISNLTMSNKSPLNHYSPQKKCMRSAKSSEIFRKMRNDNSPEEITNKTNALKVSNKISSSELKEEILLSESKKHFEFTVKQMAQSCGKSNSIQSRGSISDDFTRKRTKDEQNMAEVVPVKRSRTVSRLIENYADDELSDSEKEFLKSWKIHDITTIQPKRTENSKSFPSEEGTIESKLFDNINKSKARQIKSTNQFRANVELKKSKCDVISNKKNKVSRKKFPGISTTSLNDEPNLSTNRSSSELRKEETIMMVLEMPQKNSKDSLSSSGKEENPFSRSRSNLQEISGFHHDKCYSKEDFPIKIAFTGLVSPFLENIIDKLGGERTDDLHSCKALVTDRVYRTVKFLCAIGLGLPITSPQWLLACKNKNKFLNPWNFILKCEESEKKWNFDLRSSLEKAKSKKLLDGYSIYATKNVKPPVDDMLYIVECCGAIPLYNHPKNWPRQTIVLSCLEDKNLWPSCKFRCVKIVHYEFILSGVLQQALDFKTYKLR